MKKPVYSLLAIVLLLTSCSIKKNLEISAPFTLGEAYGQEWFIENSPKKKGYDVIMPILSLDEDEAVLHNLYHFGQMANINIELREIGMVATAQFPSKEKPEEIDLLNEEEFPFLLNETEAVLSYLHKDKVRYIKITGIRQNPKLAYPTLSAKKEN